MKDIILKIENLKVSFQTDLGLVEAVRGVDFEIEEGEAMALVGESGCGKSVTAQSVLKLHPSPPAGIDEGHIILQGKDIVNMPEYEMKKIRGKIVSMIFQDPMTSLDPTMIIGKQIGEVLSLHKGMGKKAAFNKAKDLLSQVRIANAEKRAGQYPVEFSGGMRQRAMIGMAIAGEPKLLIADEPTTALDVTIQAQIIDLLRAIQRESNMAILMITHDLGVAASIAQKVAVMYAGKIVETAGANELFHDPRHPYTWGLMNSIPQKNQDKTRDLSIIKGKPPLLIDVPKGCSFASRCKYCMRICRKEDPVTFEISDSHKCACWLLHPEAPKAEP